MQRENSEKLTCQKGQEAGYPQVREWGFHRSGSRVSPDQGAEYPQVRKRGTLRSGSGVSTGKMPGRDLKVKTADTWGAFLTKHVLRS